MEQMIWCNDHSFLILRSNTLALRKQSCYDSYIKLPDVGSVARSSCSARYLPLERKNIKYEHEEEVLDWMLRVGCNAESSRAGGISV